MEGVLALLLHCPYGLNRKNMELKAVTAAEKLQFIKGCFSVAGDLMHSGELCCKFNKTELLDCKEL